ncbi:MAG TPA: NADH-quinone oxidoreductase subunit NuoN [Roseiarcus sp.]|nr:NADH-quinone oxidoreductase subunit NuoN [Roseiarcus sp.]
MTATAFSLPTVLPEAILAAGVLVLVLLGAWRGERSVWLVTEIAVALLGVALVLLLAHHGAKAVTFFGAFTDDAFSRFMKALSLIGSLVTLLLSVEFMRREKIAGFEFPILILLATLGMMMLISATDFIALYLGLELMSLSLYVVAAYHRDNLRASEAGLKYFVLGALSSGMLLYGASLVYGFAGTVSFAGVAAAVKGQASIGLVFGLVFLLAGLAFKISAVPFHMWTPDVYEGAPTPVTAFFASAPKVAAMAVLVRVVITAFPGILGEWRQIIIFISIASMALGAFAAIGQTNFKRLMAYSSIGHMGFALVGLAAGTANGVHGVVIYMSIYLAMTLGTFAAILSMQRGGQYVEDIGDLAGLARTNGPMAFFLAAMMFSLAGVPPLAGFFAKFYVFAAAIEANLFALAVIGVLCSVVGAFYYLRIVKIIYFDEPSRAFDQSGLATRVVLALSTAIVIFYSIVPAPLTNAAMAAAKSLF